MTAHPLNLSGDAYLRFSEGPGVKFPGPTRQERRCRKAHLITSENFPNSSLTAL